MKNVLFSRICALFLGLALALVVGSGIASAAPYGKTSPSVGVLNPSLCAGSTVVPAPCAGPATVTVAVPSVPVAAAHSLAFTGAAVVGLAGVAMTTLVAGVTLILLGRRRA